VEDGVEDRRGGIGSSVSSPRACNYAYSLASIALCYRSIRCRFFFLLRVSRRVQACRRSVLLLSIMRTPYAQNTCRKLTGLCPYIARPQAAIAIARTPRPYLRILNVSRLRPSATALGN
jgi:hypothetical protein